MATLTVPKSEVERLAIASGCDPMTFIACLAYFVRSETVREKTSDVEELQTLFSCLSGIRAVSNADRRLCLHSFTTAVFSLSKYWDELLSSCLIDGRKVTQVKLQLSRTLNDRFGFLASDTKKLISVEIDCDES